MAEAVGLQNKGEVERVFQRFDANGDGKISSSELEKVIRALGSTDEISRMMEEVDTDRDGFINLAEFQGFLRNKASIDEINDRDIAELKDAFDMYDLDKDGKITEEELHQVLKMLGEGCSVHDCSRMIGGVDEDGDGTVNFEEFKSMMTNKPDAFSRSS